MGFKSYPQPPLKRFVKVKCGVVLEPNYHTARIEPAVYNKYGTPLWRFGCLIYWGDAIYDRDGKWMGNVDFCDVIIATADKKEDLK